MKNDKIVEQIDLGKEVEGSSDSELTFYVGRADDCHVFLDDKQVSRDHAEIYYNAGKWKIKKSAELNSLAVNGTAIQDQDLNVGDIVSIGPYVLSVNSLYFPPPKVEEELIEEDEVIEEELIEEAPKDSTQTMTETAMDATDSGNDDLGEDEESSGEDEAGVDEVDEDADGADEFGDNSEDEGEEFGSEDEEGEGEEGEDSDAFGGDSEEGDFEEDGELEEYDEDAGEATAVVSSFAKFELELFGEFAPYDKVTLSEPETYIGRDSKKCLIVLKDPEVSSVHAVLKKTSINCVLEDLQSGNGTLLNGSRINKSELTNSDEFIIGSTTFTVRITSDFLQKEEKRMMPVQDSETIEVEEVVEVDEDFVGDEDGEYEEGGEFGEEEEAEPTALIPKLKYKWNKLNKKQKIIYGSAGAIALFVLLSGGDGGNEEAKKAAVSKENAKKAQKKDEVTKKQESPFKVEPNKEELARLQNTYELAKNYFDQGKYEDTMKELDSIIILLKEGADFKQSRELYEAAARGLAKLEEIEKKKQAEIEAQKRQLKIEALLVKAKEATKERNVPVAEKLFEQIMQLDPENFDVPQLKLELDSWKKEQERKEMEEAAKKAERKRKVDQIQAGKSYYLQKEWYKAVLKLEDFLKITDMDEDLTKEGTKMLDESRQNLNNLVQPLLGKARSLKEGQDLKGSYQQYLSVLDHDPVNEEALNEMNEIREILNNRSKKIYREAIISESLSLFQDAKEKLQEVQQVSPTDSDYYIKATEKLKDYLD